MEQARFAPAAEEDLLAIWLRIAKDDPRTADRVWAHIRERAESLGNFPDLGPARPDIGEDARSLVVERWLVLYRQSVTGVEVVRIVDGARDLRKIGWAVEGQAP